MVWWVVFVGDAEVCVVGVEEWVLVWVGPDAFVLLLCVLDVE